MSTITLELPDNIAAQLTTPEGMAIARAAIIAEFAHDADSETILTEEGWVVAKGEQVEAGNVKPRNKAQIMARTEQLLVHL